MAASSTRGLSVAPAFAGPERRTQSRVRLIDRRLVTVSLDPKDAGLVIDLSEAGLAMQALTRVRQGATTSVQFELPDTKNRIEATGVFAWVEDGSGRAGIQFLKLCDAAQSHLKEWLARARSSAQAAVSGASLRKEDPPALDSARGDRLPEVAAGCCLKAYRGTDSRSHPR